MASAFRLPLFADFFRQPLPIPVNIRRVESSPLPTLATPLFNAA
jgi:hypothetical protein